MTHGYARARRGLVWAPLALAVLFLVAAAYLVRGAPRDIPGLEVATAEDVVDAVLDLAFPLVGALILARQPRNLFAWTFCAVGLCFEASLFAGGYSTYATFTHPGSLPGAQLMSLVSELLFVATLVLYLTLVPLLFPTGRPPTRRWWAAGAAAVAAVVLATTAMAIRPGPVDEDVPAAGANPLGIAGAGPVADGLELVAVVVLVAAVLASFASVIVRVRRAPGHERRQQKLFAAGAAVVVAVFLLPDERLGLSGPAPQIALAFVALLALPIATAVALLRRPPRVTDSSAPPGSAEPGAMLPA